MSVCRALLSVCRALLSVCRAFFSVFLQNDASTIPVSQNGAADTDVQDSVMQSPAVCCSLQLQCVAACSCSVLQQYSVMHAADSYNT